MRTMDTMNKTTIILSHNYTPLSSEEFTNFLRPVKQCFLRLVISDIACPRVFAKLLNDYKYNVVDDT